jgi:YD repeat-containing protein
MPFVAIAVQRPATGRYWLSSTEIKKLHRTRRFIGLQVVSDSMSALARTTEINCDTRAANEDCINRGSKTRTKLGYDANDNLASVSDPRSLTTTYSHDGFGGVTQQVSPDTGNTTHTYDSGGNLKSVTDARSAVATIPTTP